MAGKTLLPIKKNGQKELARWQPAGFLDEVEREMERVFDRWGFGPWPMPRLFHRGMEMPSTWAPRIDVFEKEGKLVIKADLPGLKTEDVQVELDRGDLVLRGESRAEEKVAEEDYYRLERRFGSFYRRVQLPFEVEPEQVQATFEDGVLEVAIPKPVETKPETRKITVA